MSSTGCSLYFPKIFNSHKSPNRLKMSPLNGDTSRHSTLKLRFLTHYLKTTHGAGLLRHEYQNEHVSKTPSDVTLLLEVFKYMAWNRTDPYLGRRAGSKFVSCRSAQKCYLGPEHVVGTLTHEHNMMIHNREGGG